MYRHVCIDVYIYIYIYTHTHYLRRVVVMGLLSSFELHVCMDIPHDSSKGGAVETGCSDLYNVIYDFVT